MLNNKKYLAFSLIEMLLVLAISAILLGMSYPSYIEHMVKVRRNNAAISLICLASRLEQYYSEQHTYSGATAINLGIKSDGFYIFEIASANEVNFLIKAIPLGKQAQRDAQCGSLILDNLGNRSIDGVGNANSCW